MEERYELYIAVRDFDSSRSPSKILLAATSKTTDDDDDEYTHTHRHNYCCTVVSTLPSLPFITVSFDCRDDDRVY